MINTRESIYAALFAKLSGVAGFQTTSRRLQHWNDVPVYSQPALFMTQTKEVALVSPSKPTKWEMHVDLHLYVKTSPGTALSPSITMNPLLDAIETALAPDGPNSTFQTLGGLVTHVYIDGEITTYEGTLGDQEVAVIPIKILTT